METIYDRLLIEEATKKGESPEKIQTKIRTAIALTMIIELPQMSNKKIAQLINSEEVFVQTIRTFLEEKKLTNLDQVIVKAFQKVGITKQVDIASIVYITKKHCLLFHQEEIDK